MSRFDEPQFEPLLDLLRAHIREEHYGVCARWSYPYAARCFLRELERRGRAVGSVSPADLERYLDSLRLKRRRGPFPDQLRRMHRAAIHMLLRLVQGRWPPQAPPATGDELAIQESVTAFDAWMQDLRGLSPSTRRHRRSEMRQLLEWLYDRNTDPRTRIPPPGLLPFQPKRARPYLYSDDEIQRLLRAALEMPCRYERGELRPWVYYCLFGLLSVSGLRLGEARNLELQDVDLEAAVLTIRGTKFGKTRLVPVHASTCVVLATYIARRKRHWIRRPVSSYLFVSSWGNRLDSGQIHRAFYTLSRQIGLRGVSDSHGPRLHDMRHRFATNTLVRWYRSEQDPERRLPILSAYLGHVHVADTQWYLDGSPELMREAMGRLEHRWEGRQ
jgi:integrase/recombinase XerD